MLVVVRFLNFASLVFFLLIGRRREGILRMCIVVCDEMFRILGGIGIVLFSRSWVFSMLREGVFYKSMVILLRVS